MNCEDALPLLHDEADGPLPNEEARALADHLATCEDCRSLRSDLARLSVAAAALPREVRPSRDLWPGIAARIRPAPRRSWGTVRGLAAAAVLVVASSWATARWIETQPAPVPESAGWEKDMDVATDELRAALDARRADLDPATWATVQENLDVIDHAIAETKSALDADPGDRRLREALVKANERKLSLLRRAVALDRAK